MPQPRIGLSMLYTLSEPFGKMIKQLDKTPTAYVEVVDDGWHTLNKKRVAALNEAAKSFDLKFSVHAPFADINVASPSKLMLNTSLKRLLQSLTNARALNAYLWVLHPGSKSGISAFYPGADWEQNFKSIRLLHKAAREFGVTIAMENLPEKYGFLMRKPEDFQRFYEETGLEDIGIVLDTGHANLEGQILPFLQKLPNKIAHVHVSDNHGETDEHLGLGYGAIDWPQFAKALKAAGFSGTVLAESVYNVEETVRKLQKLLA
jgi:sugar phosphate isomerase/epimerase